MYIVEQEQIDALRALSARLHNGTDRERDEGHRLMLLIDGIEGQRAHEVTSLYATIRKSSKYAYQQPRDMSQRLAPPIPFEVSISDTRDAYNVRGNSNQYRMEDLRFWARVGDRYIPLSK